MNSDYLAKIKSYYNLISSFYFIPARIDQKARNRGILFSKPKKGDKVLCVGSATGAEIRRFKSFGCITFGVEISKGMIKVGKKKNNTRSVLNADCFAIPYKDNSFDIIYSSYLIDIFDEEDRLQVLNEMVRVTKVGGMIISVNNTFEKGRISKLLVTYYSFVKDNIYKRMKTRPIDATDVFNKAKLYDIKNKKVAWGTEAVSGIKLNK